MTVLSLRGVTFRYPASRAPALRNISLDVQRGEVLALIGRVGAGASTLLLVAGDLAPRVLGGELSGTVERGGRAALLLPTPWTQVSGMAFTVADEVAFGPANLGWPLPRISASVERALTGVDVAHLRDIYDETAAVHHGRDSSPPGATMGGASKPSSGKRRRALRSME